MEQRTCCNQDCCQGRICPARHNAPWWAEILVVLTYVLAAVLIMAVVVYGGSKLASSVLAITPAIK